MLDEGLSRVSEDTTQQVRELVDGVYRSESRQVLATLIRLLGDFDAAEEALHDAFAVAVEQWPQDGVPANPRAWLVSTGRFKAIDGMRRRARFDASLPELAKQLESSTSEAEAAEEESVDDDRLRLIFTCCHPALAPDAQVAMTLREVCGLTTDEIARAFLTAPPTLAQRIVRAKAKIRDARIPYDVPSETDLPDRLDAVLRVVYLVFNEGYSASSGGSLTRHDLSGEAIRLGRLLIELLPEPEAMGLLALMLLHDSRRAARTSSTGDLILLDDQDRSLWNQDQIAEGASLVERALASRHIGPYTLQAAIAAVHAQAPNRRRHGLGPDRRALRCADAGESLARGRTESRRGDCDARRSFGGSGPHRHHPGTGRSGELSSGARGTGGSLPATGENSRSPNLLRTGPRPHPAGAGAAVSQTTAARTVGLMTTSAARTPGLRPDSRSCSDGQYGNFVVLESEVVPQLDRTSWKSAADLGCNNNHIAHIGKVSYLGLRVVLRVGSVYPPFDCIAATILVPLISYEGIGSEDSNEVIRIVRIKCFKKSGDGRR